MNKKNGNRKRVKIEYKWEKDKIKCNGTEWCEMGCT